MEMKKWLNKQDGFTMIEMIITIGVMAVLASAVIVSFSIISSGNASKSTARFLNRLDAVQVEDMTKTGVTYLYLYKDSDGVKTFMCNDGTEEGLTNRTDLMTQVSAGNGTITDIAGSGVDFTLPDGTNSADDADLVVKIAFEKGSGAFACSKKIEDTTGTVFYDKISFKGRQTTDYSVKMLQNTGKHMKG